MNGAESGAEGLDGLIAELGSLRDAMLGAGAGPDGGVHPEHQDSAANLRHYLALRRRDVRPMQEALASLGLSSLGRAEAHVLDNVSAVLRLARMLAGRSAPAGDGPARAITRAQGRALLDRHARRLLGPGRGGRSARIMVTMPTEAARDPGLSRDLVRLGMDVARINAAHDGPDAWEAMARHARAAGTREGVDVRVMIDLPGPKLRTAPLPEGPRVARWRPERDALGRVQRPARVWLDARGEGDEGGVPADADVRVPVSPGLLDGARAGDLVTLRDTRGRRRVLRLTRADPRGAMGEAQRTGYVATGLELERRRDGRVVAGGRVGALPPVEQPIVLRVGDRLLLTRDAAPGGPGGGVGGPARVGCTLGAVLDDVRVGERVLLDDGKIACRARARHPDGVELEVTHAGARGSALRGDKGINLPDTALSLDAITEQDRRDLAWVARLADVVGVSFVRDAAHVREVGAILDAHGGGGLGLVLKIETARAFDALPALLLEAMRRPAAGVMIARGDLGVEVGFERLAEVQEEILWMCEAAHVPVIWATQVLESLAKRGQPSRAEVTDAAMGERAECVMLNKGPYVREAVRTLDDILRRMDGHQSKKSAMLRPLGVAERFEGT